MNYEEYAKFGFSKNLRYLVSKIDDLEKAYLKSKKVSISVRELEYIALIAENPKKPFAELIKLESVSKSTFSNQVKALEEKGFVTYETFENNKKSKHLALTTKGQKVFSYYEEIRQIIFERFVKDVVSEAEMKKVATAAGKLYNGIKKEI